MMQPRRCAMFSAALERGDFRLHSGCARAKQPQRHEELARATRSERCAHSREMHERCAHPWCEPARSNARDERAWPRRLWRWRALLRGASRREQVCFVRDAMRRLRAHIRSDRARSFKGPLRAAEANARGSKSIARALRKAQRARSAARRDRDFAR
jgi:hypothetical protein